MDNNTYFSYKYLEYELDDLAKNIRSFIFYDNHGDKELKLKLSELECLCIDASNMLFERRFNK